MRYSDVGAKATLALSRHHDRADPVFGAALDE